MQYRLIEDGVGNYIIQQQRDGSTPADKWTYHSNYSTDLKRAHKLIASLRERDVLDKKTQEVKRIIE